MNITFAKTDKVKKFQSEIDLILQILGYEDGLVTDESRLNDFLINPELFEEEVDRINEWAFNSKLIDTLSKESGINIIHGDMLIVDIAKHMHEYMHFEGEIL